MGKRKETIPPITHTNSPNVDMRSTNSRKTKTSGAGDKSEQETPIFSEPSHVKELVLQNPLNVGDGSNSMQVILDGEATRGRSAQRRDTGERAEIRLDI